MTDDDRLAVIRRLVRASGWGSADVALFEELVAERDTLRARINAARWVYINVTSRFEAAVKMNAALAGDQPEAPPEPVKDRGA